MSGELIERVEAAIAKHQHQGWLYDETAVSMLDPAKLAKTRAELTRAARAAIEATNVATLEAALRTIQDAVPKYLKKEMTAEEFALVVIGEVDNKAVFRALGGEKR